MTAPSTAAAAQELRQRIKLEAEALGLVAVRITEPQAIRSSGERLMEFLEAGRHGDMSWMETHAARRRDPSVLWPEVRSVIMAGISYAPDHDPLEVLSQPSRAAISVYAQGRDYHDILKGKLKKLAAMILAATACDVKVFVDTAPLMEKPLAAAAGVGWQGKHTNLVSREHGSWLFLGAILTTAEIAIDEPEADHCGTCQRCLDVCPTNAFPAPYQLDARRCIAYLTVEHKGHIAREFRVPIGNRIFGCDDCLAVCPWNKFAERVRETQFHVRSETDNPALRDLLALDDAAFRWRFAGTPVKRTGRDRFLRNVLIAAGNSADTTLLPSVVSLLEDPSPLVRAMAVWALSRLADAETFSRERAKRLGVEADQAVHEEWRLGDAP